MLYLSPEKMGGGGSERAILLVEGDLVTREALEDLLDLAGLVVYSAANGREALTLFDQHKLEIEAVILSARLQGNGTAQLIDDIVARDARVRLVLASGYTLYEARQILGERHWSAYIQKPFSSAELLHTLSRVLNRKLN